VAVPASSYLLEIDGLYSFGMEPAPMPGLILGDSFIRSSYVVFDRVNKQIGFASPTNACDL
jgi:hypothetical protein